MALKLPLIVINSGVLEKIVDDKCVFIVNRKDIVNEMLRKGFLTKNGRDWILENYYYKIFCIKI